jgi:hypothetical protein
MITVAATAILLLLAGLGVRTVGHFLLDVRAESLTDDSHYRATVARPFEIMEAPQRIDIVDERGIWATRIARVCSTDDSPVYPVWEEHRLRLTYPGGGTAALAEVADGQVEWLDRSGVADC